MTSDILLTSVFGGLLNACAIALCLIAGATSGGTDFIAIFIAQKYNKDAWNYILAFNLVILSSVGFLFGWDKEFIRSAVLEKYYPQWAKQKYDDFHDEYTFNSTCPGSVGPAIICFLSFLRYLMTYRGYYSAFHYHFQRVFCNLLFFSNSLRNYFVLYIGTSVIYT